MASEHSFLHQARRDLERAEASKKKAELLLRTAEFDITRLKFFIDQYEIYLSELDRGQQFVRPRNRARNITDIAVSIIEAADGPISIALIIEKMGEMNIEVGGENKSANLAAYLSKDIRVRYERGLGWMLSTDALFPEELTGTGERSRGSSPDGMHRMPQPQDQSESQRRRQRLGPTALDDDIPF